MTARIGWHSELTGVYNQMQRKLLEPPKGSFKDIKWVRQEVRNLLDLGPEWGGAHSTQAKRIMQHIENVGAPPVLRHFGVGRYNPKNPSELHVETGLHNVYKKLSGLNADWEWKQIATTHETTAPGVRPTKTRASRA